MEMASRKSVHLFLCSLMCLLFGNLSLVAIVTSQTITIPNRYGNLSNYLCGNLSLAITNGTTLELNPYEQHIVSGQSCVWQNRHHFTVQSSGPSVATIQCIGDDLSRGMFGFVQASDIRLRNLRFENCGGIIQSTGTEGHTESEPFVPINTSSAYALSHNQQAVLFLSHCTDVTIDNVTFINYSGYAIYAINLFGDTTLQQVTVTNSFAFENNMTSWNGTDLTYSGSGIYFQFINKTLPSVTSTNSNVTMTNCTISNNFNIYPDIFLKSLLETRLQDQPGDFPLYGAGGLTVHFEQSQHKAQLYVENTNFTNNGGSAGGGAYITTQNTLDNSDIIFTGCAFVKNRVHEDSSYFEGAGIKLSFIFYFPLLFQVSKYAGTTKANITVMNSIFQSHSTKAGAAMAIFTEAQNISIIKVDLKNITFIDNEATIDGDCITAKSEDSAYFSEAGFRINLESIQVLHKHSSHSDLDKSAALSFTNIDFVDVSGTDENPTIISNGNNGAVKAFNTNLFLSGNVQFRNNSATRGGALALEANSHLFFKEPTNILFLNNSAKKGGAIYSDIISGYQCVMQFISHANDNSYEATNISDLEKLDFNITFINNTADDGNAVYAQPIYNCSWYSGSVVQLPTDSVENVYRKLLNFEANQTYKDHMRSHPYRPCFCEVSNSPMCRSDLSNHMSVNLSFPGRPFKIHVVPADRRWRPLRAVVESKLEDESGIFFENNHQIDVIDITATSCFSLTYVLHKKKYYNESVNTTIKLSTLGTVGQFIEIDVSLEKCPFGFKLNESSGICDCVPLLARNDVQCNIKTGQFIKAETYWIGKTHFEPDIVACATKCPDGYCQRSTIVNQQLEKQCLGNRMGEICGQCTPKLQSMKFGTTDCGNCSNFWLFTIFLYMLAGIILVITLFLFKLTISEGPFGAVIFYAQLLSINLGTLVYSSKIAKYVVIFISLLNLELGFPICFYNGMDQIGKQGLQFVFPVYLWLIVAVITILSRHSNKLANLVGSDCAKVFVTLIYLSYTKLLRTSSAVFVPARIGTDTNHTYLVWFLDGSVLYFRGLHLLLGLIALAFIMFILTPYKVFIFLGQWCLHNSWISRHFKPLIDATLAPFKDRWRFWFGMRLFIIDSFILVSIVVSPISSNSVISANLIIVVLLLVFQVNTKPYKSKLLHYLDLFFLINYVLFLIGHLFIHRILPSDIDCHACTDAIAILFIGSAFVVFVMIVSYYITVRVREFSKERGQMKLKKLRDVNMNEIETTSVPISHGTMQRVIAMDLNEHESVRLRESLLADD